jgi:hypothetical protein
MLKCFVFEMSKPETLTVKLGRAIGQPETSTYVKLEIVIFFIINKGSHF